MRFPDLTGTEPGSLLAWARQLTRQLGRDIKPFSSGSLTLQQNTTTTLVPDQASELGGAIILTPTTANAASAVATTYVSDVSDGSFTVTHASNTQEDRVFYYAVYGPDLGTGHVG